MFPVFIFQDPLGEINLRTCVTESVDLVARDVCARPNTFLLVTVRPVQKTDKVSYSYLFINFIKIL